LRLTTFIKEFCDDEDDDDDEIFGITFTLCVGLYSIHGGPKIGTIFCLL